MEGDNRETVNISFQSLRFDELKFSITDEELRRLRLCYRGEGNDNLVLQAPDVKFVLRFRKSELMSDHTEKNTRISFAFYYIFVKPFYSTYFSIPIIAKISKSEVRKLDDMLYVKRPSYRRGKRIFYTGVEIHPDYAFLSLYAEYLKSGVHLEFVKAPVNNRLRSLLSEDYLKYRDFVFTVITDVNMKERLLDIWDSQTDTMCVEIKPKQGWTAVPDRFELCPYCMHQYLKLSTSKIAIKSDYCPLDLFSGSTIRMKKALMALLKEPQNNLRIFKNGEQIFGNENVGDIDRVLCEWFKEDSQKCMDEFYHLISNILLKELTNEDEHVILCQPHMKTGQHTLCPNVDRRLLGQSLHVQQLRCQQGSDKLPKNSILGRIMRLQQLDEAGIETAYDYSKLHEHEFTSNFDYVEKLVSNTNLLNGRIALPELNVVEAYLLSAMAKDLSILIALKSYPTDRVRNRNVTDPVVLDLNERPYHIAVSVVDVGPKPVSCVEKHWKRDTDILTACARYFCPESVIPSASS